MTKLFDMHYSCTTNFSLSTEDFEIIIKLLLYQEEETGEYHLFTSDYDSEWDLASNVKSTKSLEKLSDFFKDVFDEMFETINNRSLIYEAFPFDRNDIKLTYDYLDELEDDDSDSVRFGIDVIFEKPKEAEALFGRNLVKTIILKTWQNCLNEYFPKENTNA